MDNSLYRISAQQLRLNDMLEETGGELTPELEEALRINADEFDTKAEQYCLSIQRYADLEGSIAREIERLQALRKRVAAISVRLRSHLLGAMECFGMTRAEVGTRRLSVRTSSSVVVDDTAALPARFVRTNIHQEPDKVAIREAMKAGEEVPGARLEYTSNIQIR